MGWEKIDIVIIFDTTGMLLLAFAILLLTVVYRRRLFQKRQEIEVRTNEQNPITQE